MATRPSVLLIDDDPDFSESLSAFLSPSYDVSLSGNGEEGLASIAQHLPDACLLDLDLGSGMDGFEVLRALRAHSSPPPIVVLTGDRDIRSAVRAMKHGAFHYVCKPPEVQELANLIDLAIERRHLRTKVAALESEIVRLSGRFIAASPSMRGLVDRIERVAPTGATVLITGECGTGKEMFARLLHDQSDRPTEPFVGVNCAAVPGELIESELFGHEQGAFTDAKKSRVGKFQMAGHGTLFLDEIGDSSTAFQLKLLRVLEDRRYFSVGSDREQRLNARVCAATSRDLEAEVRAGRFREELFYRLNVYRIHVPPLRDRPEDIPLLAHHFTRQSSRSFGRSVASIDDAAMDYLCSQRWQGNVRELRNVVERAVLECDVNALGIEHVVARPTGQQYALREYEEAKAEALESFKRQYLLAQLRRSSGNVSQAARYSGIARQSLSRMLREIGLQPSAFRRDAAD